jgi:hypothetical protein
MTRRRVQEPFDERDVQPRRGIGSSGWLRHWPALAGLAFAGAVTFGMTSGVEMTAILAAAAVVYLGAAALRTPRASWPLFFGTGVVITLARLLDDTIEPAWVLLGAGVLLIGYGLLRGALRPAYAMPLQTLALLGFGAVATVALLVDPVVGSCLVAFGLLGHAGWDLYHYKVNRVVARSLAEFCLLLDASLAVLILVVTFLEAG